MSKESLNRARLVAQELKNELPKQEKGKTVIPEDLTVMLAGKMATELMEQRVRNTNILKAYEREYQTIPDDVRVKIAELIVTFDKGFEKAKRALEKEVEDHPLVDRMTMLRGITPWQVANLIGHIKDIRNFDTPSSLCVYAGVACINGKATTKATIKDHKEYYYVNGIGEFKGFNTKLAGRLHVIGESLIRAKGWFYCYYQRTRKRLHEKAINEGRAYIPTDEERKGTLMKKGRYYMKGKKNYSLESYTHNGAFRRVQRVFLHLFYTEWRTHSNLPARNPYPLEYLGHTTEIKFTDVLEAELKMKDFSKEEKEEFLEELISGDLNLSPYEE